MKVFVKFFVTILLGLMIMPGLSLSEDIQNILTKTPPTDKDGNSGSGSRTDDAGGGYWKSSNSQFGWLQPGIYAGAYAWSYVWGTRYAEGTSEGYLGIDNFDCIKSSNYNVSISNKLSGVVGVYVPRGIDSHGSARGRVSVVFEWRVFDETSGHSQIFYKDSVFYSADKNYCVGADAELKVYSNHPVMLTCPNVALVAGHRYSCEVKLRCWGKGEAYGATSHQAYVAAVFTFPGSVFNFGPWNLSNNGRMELSSITFEDTSPDHTPPVTNITNGGGTYCEPTTFELSATDNPAGYGLEATYYSLNGGDWQLYSSPFGLSENAVLTFYSKDRAGNSESVHTETFIFPSVPAFPSVSYEAGCDYIDIMWGVVSGANEYCVYRDGELMACVSENSWRDTGPGSTQRTYSVMAKNDCFESSQSAPVVCKINTSPNMAILSSPPSAETGLSQPVSLIWNDIDGATEYNLQVAEDFAFSTIAAVIMTSETSDEIGNLKFNTKYYWRVRAGNDCGNGAWSEIWNFTTECPAVSTISLSSPQNGVIGVSQPVNLAWQALSDVEKYQIQIDDNSEFQNIDLLDFDMTETEMVCPELSGGICYYWRVRAYNGCSWGDWSAAWSFVTDETSDLANTTDNQLPDRYFLSQNFPNPFNPVTRITFGLPRSEYVTLEILNILGEKIETLISADINAGNYSYTWDGTNVPSGIYIYKIHAGNFIQAKKMILLK